MGHNGGFNPYRDANGEYATPERAGKPGRNRKRGSGRPARQGGADFTNSRPVSQAVGTGQEISRVRRGTAYRSRLDKEPLPTARPGVQLSTRERETAAAIVNAYAGPRGRKLSPTADNATILRRLRSTGSRIGPNMSREEFEGLDALVGKLTRPTK